MSTTDAKTGKRPADNGHSVDDMMADADQHVDKQAAEGTCAMAFRKAFERHCRCYKLAVPPGNVLYIPILSRFIRANNVAAATASSSSSVAAASSSHKAKSNNSVASTTQQTHQRQHQQATNEDDNDSEAVDVEELDHTSGEDDAEADHDDDDDDEDDDDEDFVVDDDDEDNEDEDDEDNDATAKQGNGHSSSSPQAVARRKNKAAEEGEVANDDVEEGDEDDDNTSSSGTDRDEDVHIAGYAIDPEAPVHVYSTPAQALNYLLQQPRRRRSSAPQESSYGLVLCLRVRDTSCEKTLLNFMPDSVTTVQASARDANDTLAALLGGVDEVEAEDKNDDAGSDEGNGTATAPVAEVDLNTAKIVDGEYVYDESESLSSSDDSSGGDDDDADDDDDDLPSVACSLHDLARLVCHYGNDEFTIDDSDESTLLSLISEYLPPGVAGWLTADVDDVPAIRISWETVAVWFACSTVMRATGERVDAYYAEHKMTKNDLYMGVRPKLSEIERLDMVRRCLVAVPQ